MYKWFTNSGRIFARLLSFAFLFRLPRVTSTTAFQLQRSIQNENYLNENIEHNSPERYLDDSALKQWKTFSLANGQLSEFQQPLYMRQKRFPILSKNQN